jgi:hypothetical protein
LALAIALVFYSISAGENWLYPDINGSHGIKRSTMNCAAKTKNPVLIRSPYYLCRLWFYSLSNLELAGRHSCSIDKKNLRIKMIKS